MTSLTQKETKLILKRCQLQDEEAQILMKNIKRSKVNKLMIREILAEQDQPSREIYFLLEGSVHLIATLANGQKCIISEIGQNDFLNTEILLNNKKSKYTIAVSSSFIMYITLEEKDFNVFIYRLKEELQNTLNFRQKIVQKKNKKIGETIRKKKLQENINKLSLPNIDFKTLKKNYNLFNPNQNIQQNIKTLQNLPVFSKSLKNVTKGTSLQKLPLYEKPRAYVQNIQQQNLQAASSKILQQFHQYRDKIAQKKLQRLKSERSLSLNEKQPKEINYQRNQKLFKEQLKDIVRRKLQFERNHFKVLKRLNNKDQRYKQIQFNREVLKKIEQQNQNPIDNYFNI